MSQQGRKSVTLDKAIELYLEKLKPERLSESSMISKRRTLGRLAETAGRVNRSVRKLTDEDFQRCIASLAAGASPAENAARARKGLRPRTGRTPKTMEADRATLRQFVAYCKHQGWMRPGFDPMFRITTSTRPQGDTAPTRVRKRRSLPEEEWSALLEAAGSHHPRTRMIVAAGLLWGRRASEISHMQWKHIKGGTVEFFNIKRGRPVSSGGIVISPWMQAELGRWRAWVEAEHGPVQPDWYVCPAKLHINELDAISKRHSYPVDPTLPMAPRYVTRDAKRALKRFGWSDDDLFGEGGHTLRRSFAQGVEDAAGVEAVQAGLDHETTSQSQHYSGNRRGHKALNARMSTWVPPGSEVPGDDSPALKPPLAPAGTVPTQAEAPRVESNVVDFTAWRARRAG